MTKSQTRPLYDLTGRQIARVGAAAMRHLGHLVVECDRGHLYTAESWAVMRGDAPECAICPAVVADDEREAA